VTPEEAQAGVRDSALIAVTAQFVESLKALGIQSYVIGYALNEDPEGQGMTKIEGNATLVLNLIASVVKGMRPEDFKNLLGVMMFGDYFSDQRAKIGMVDKPRETNKERVN
jgi:hypothetical protein